MYYVDGMGYVPCIRKKPWFPKALNACRSSAHYVKKDGWFITHLAGLTIMTTTLVGTATNFTTTGTSTNLYKNLGATNYPVTFKETPVTVVCPDGTVLKADTVGNSTTKFETRIMFDGTTGWMGSKVPYRVSVIAIGIV